MLGKDERWKPATRLVYRLRPWAFEKILTENYAVYM